MVGVIADLSGDFRHLDERLDDVTAEIETLAKADDACQRMMTVPGIGPIIASAMVSAVGDGAAYGVGGVHDPPHALGEGKERDHQIPVAPPAQCDRRILLAPGAVREVIQRGLARPRHPPPR